MSNYTKTTNFATKDNLSPGNPLKIVKGTEIDTEYNNIATAIATKTDNSAAAITGGTITGITDLAVADGGTGASTAAAALNNLLPSQTSNANKYLQTDGTNASWDAVSLSTADITGTLAVANGGTGVTTSTGTTNVVLSNSPTLVTPALGTPSAAVLTNATGLPISTGVSGLGSGVATLLATPSSANLASAITDETGSGALVFATSPTLVTPILGTPTSGVATNLTGLPLTTGVTGLLPIANGGTATATPSIVAGTNITVTGTWPNQTIAASGGGGSPGGSTTQVQYNNAGAFGGITGATTNGTALTLVAPNLGTPASGTLTNATGLPLSTGVTGTLPVANGGTGITSFGTGIATLLGTPSSANLAAALTDETGSGSAVFATSPTLVTPILGTPTSATLTNATGLPISTGVSGLGTGVATALAVNVGSAGAAVVNGGALGTPSSGTLTSATGLPLSTGVTGTLPVANGGTSLATLTANNVILGNGTSAPLFVAPSTSGNLLTSNGTTWQSTAPAASGGFTLGTPVATTSGTSVTFTGIPSNAKTIYVNFNDFSANYAGNENQILVQIGDSGGIETTGYQSVTGAIESTSVSGQNVISNAFSIRTGAYTRNWSGIFLINLESTANNSWVNTGLMSSYGDNVVSIGASRKSLSGVLTQLKISVDGVYSFTGGEVNISYGT